jgi:hypothetical protein
MVAFSIEILIQGSDAIVVLWSWAGLSGLDAWHKYKDRTEFKHELAKEYHVASSAAQLKPFLRFIAPHTNTLPFYISYYVFLHLDLLLCTHPSSAFYSTTTTNQ